MKKILPLLLLTPTLTNAECTPTPDCASIGYTETSCEGDSLKCPFDTSKLFCAPCDSSFQYDCTGDNIIGGVGSSCGGKYVSCECSSTDYIFTNGSCICDTSCKVGAIYYSDGSCNSCLDTNKTPIGIVVKNNELVMSNKLVSMIWHYSTNISGITEITDSGEVKQDFNGKANTLATISHIGTSSKAAAIYCNEYAPVGMENTKGKWYLPAAGELYSYVCGNYASKLSSTNSKLNWSIGGYFWSSSEYNSTKAWVVMTYCGPVFEEAKNTSYPVSCFLSIN